MFKFRMTKLSGNLLVILWAAGFCLPSAGGAQPAAEDAPVREIFVPFEDLNVILESDVQRVYLTRQQYEDLVRQADVKAPRQPPIAAALVDAQYQGQLEVGRAIITGRLTVEALQDDLQAVPLELAGVGIRKATLDNQAAPLYRDEQGRTLLLVSGRGLHHLDLELTAPLETEAARQSLHFRLPSNTATRLQLKIPGNVEVKAGAAVIERRFDADADQTTLDLVPGREQMSIVMSLNNRLLQQQRVMVARSVIVDEITQGYERIHATVSFRILHGATETLRLSLPSEFEVTRVQSPLMSRWQEVSEADGRTTLEVTLREAASDTVVLQLTANRSPDQLPGWMESLQQWTFPGLEPLDTAGQVAVLGVILEDRLQPEALVPQQLLPIDSAFLATAVPESVLQAEPGAPVVRQVAAYYAPSEEYALAARFRRPDAGLSVAANSLLVLGDQGLSIQGGLALTPKAEQRFDVAVLFPAGWQVSLITDANGQELSYQRYDQADGGTRVDVRLPRGIAAGETFTINYQATTTPPGWLDAWDSQDVTFPQVTVQDATAMQGAIAVQAIDDLTVASDQLEGLTALLENDKQNFGLGQIPTDRAYRFDQPDYAAQFSIQRTRPTVTARLFNFFRMETDNLHAHYELHYDVRRARARSLEFSIPIETPTELTILGLQGVQIKEFNSRDQQDRRIWTVELAEQMSGAVWLAVQFQQSLPDTSEQSVNLPLVQAEGVQYQSARVAVEGSVDLDVSIATDARQIDVGELAEAQHTVGRQLIGAFGYLGTDAQVRAAITRRDPYHLPPALIQRAELVTKVSSHGRAQSVARYDLVTLATLLEVRLPADAQLWTILLDDEPTKPQRQQNSLLLSLEAGDRTTIRKLQVVYETPSRPLGWLGEVEAVAPQLLVRAAGTDAERMIPQADLEWLLYLPTGYEARAQGGTVFHTAPPERPTPLLHVGKFLYWASGGIQPRSFELQSAREAARSFAPSASMADGLATDPAAMEGEDFADSMPKSEADATPRDEPNEERPQSDPTAATAAPATPPQEPSPAGPPAGAEGRTDSGRQSAVNAGAKKQPWALQGVSSLQIDLDTHFQIAINFHSLGEQPRLRVATVDARRTDAAAWGLALTALLIGFRFTRKSVASKARLVAAILLLATVPIQLTSRLDHAAQIFEYLFYAGCFLAVYFPVAALVLVTADWLRDLVRWDRQPRRSTVAGWLLVAVAMAITSRAAEAQPSLPATVLTIDDLLPLLDDAQGPVAVPEDAIIVPYDPQTGVERNAGQQLLVPYARYVELWNKAFPDRRITEVEPVVDFALCDANYQMSLDSGSYLLVTGQLQLVVYRDQPVVIPLQLGGGVLQQITIDGKAARLQVEGGDGAGPGQAAGQGQAAEPLRERTYLLYVEGQGRKQVQISIRMALEQQGGWRRVSGRLPVGQAAAVTLTAVHDHTEVRQTGLVDRPAFELTAAGQRIESALQSDGRLDLQWRPKVGEARVDQALTASSQAVFDVRQDALRIVWQVQLEFGRGIRDNFTMMVPGDYLVERVSGDNVRGWQASDAAGSQLVDVTLLKPATGRETLTLHLSRRGAVGRDGLTEVQVPGVLVRDAALQQGEITIRRSPRLELRTISVRGLSRIDNQSGSAALEQLADAEDASVLTVQRFQSFRFVEPGYQLTLSARPASGELKATVRAALRVADRETELDAAIQIQPSEQPVYQVQIALPDTLQLQQLGPSGWEWSVTEEQDGQVLTVYLLDGYRDPFTITLFGNLERAATNDANADAPRRLAMPKLEVLGAATQEGEWVVLPDPDVDVRLEDLTNCQASPLAQGVPWLKAEQQPLARAVLRHRRPDYSATLVLTPRTPLVSARSISNVRITAETIEETVLIELQIEQAGINRVSVLLPEHLANAHVQAKLLKRRTVEPATAADGQPMEGFVRMAFELQDFVRGDYSILVEHDRLFSADKQQVQLPIIETGRTDRRMLALENVGRDEIQVADADVLGLEPINRQQQAWRELAAVLGDQVTQAYLARESQTEPSTTGPQLSFTTLVRKEVEKAGARIALAETLLVVDAAGAYRALVTFRVVNSDEQFLELKLPEGARLWTATVAGQPVKAATPSPPQPGVARIPLIKTAAGEGDYAVELKYGGLMEAPSPTGTVRFPLIQDTNINIELSQVRLLVPESHQWFGFQGTMRLVEDESQLDFGFQSYLKKRIQEASQVLSSSSSEYTKVRALVNLKQARQMLEQTMRQADGGEQAAIVRGLQMSNSQLLDQTESMAQEQLAQQASGPDNRYRLNQYWMSQDVERSKNVVSELGLNFDATDPQAEGKAQSKTFNSEWFEQNKLAGEMDQGEAGELVAGKPGDADYRYLRGRDRGEKADSGYESMQQQAPQVAGQLQLKILQDQTVDEPQKPQPDDSKSAQLFRYQQQLEQQNLAVPSNQPAQTVDAIGGRGDRFGGIAGGGGFGAGGAGLPAVDVGGDDQSQPDGRPELIGGQSFGEITEGLASLDIQLPERGRLYYFTTPRGEMRIEARAVPESSVRRFINLGIILAVVAVTWLVARKISLSALRTAVLSRPFSILLSITGVVSMVGGVFPMAGLLATACGIGLLIRHYLAKGRGPAVAA